MSLLKLRPFSYKLWYFYSFIHDYKMNSTELHYALMECVFVSIIQTPVIKCFMGCLGYVEELIPIPFSLRSLNNSLSYSINPIEDLGE